MTAARRHCRFVQFANRRSFCAERVVPHDSDNLLFLILPFRIEGFGLGVEINAEELFHVYGIRSFKRGSENRPKEFFHVEMTCGVKNANWLVNRFRCDLCKMTGSAIDGRAKATRRGA